MAKVQRANVPGVVSLLCAQLVFQSILITIIFNVRDVWFLSYWPASMLTWAQLAVAALIPRSTALLKGSGSSRGRVFSMQVIHIYAAVLFGIFAVSYPYIHKPTAVFAIYVMSDVMIQVVVGIFWDICAEIFDVQQSKRLFGIINSGSLFGSAFAGFFFIPWEMRWQFVCQSIKYMFEVSYASKP